MQGWIQIWEPDAAFSSSHIALVGAGLTAGKHHPACVVMNIKKQLLTKGKTLKWINIFNSCIIKIFHSSFQRAPQYILYILLLLPLLRKWWFLKCVSCLQGSIRFTLCNLIDWCKLTFYFYIWTISFLFLTLLLCNDISTTTLSSRTWWIKRHTEGRNHLVERKNIHLLSRGSGL